MSAPAFTLHRGSAPLLVSVPHAGREIPAALRDAYVPRALDVEDTDWHVGSSRVDLQACKLEYSIVSPK